MFLSFYMYQLLCEPTLEVAVVTLIIKISGSGAVEVEGKAEQCGDAASWVFQISQCLKRYCPCVDHQSQRFAILRTVVAKVESCRPYTVI